METRRWREQWAGKVRSPGDWVRFVNAVGCSATLPGYPDFPHAEPVMGKIDPAAPHPWWWKDDLHIAKRLYYTRVFGGKPGFVSFALLPALIATNGAVADELMLTGAMSAHSHQVYSVIEANGPIPIRKLKQLLTPSAKCSANTILHRLERQFIITKTGITGRDGNGPYGNVWDLVERWIPGVLTAADRLGREQAQVIIREHLEAFDISRNSQFYRKVLGWEE